MSDLDRYRALIYSILVEKRNWSQRQAQDASNSKFVALCFDDEDLPHQVVDDLNCLPGA